MLKIESNDIKIACGLNFLIQVDSIIHCFELYDKTINS